MGLENFQTSSSTSSRTTKSRKSEDDKQENQGVSGEPYKKVSCDRGRVKVFPTEEDWEDTVEQLEDMGYSAGEVLNMSKSDKHEILHKAILNRSGNGGGGFHPTKHCLVCGEKFVFPKNWRFVRFKGEAVCPTHEIGEAVEEASKVNQLDIQDGTR